jgi:predicted site-specific integrase-resolvase
VVILDENKEKNFEEELVGDVIELMTVFCARIYGRRSHANRKKAA